MAVIVILINHVCILQLISNYCIPYFNTLYLRLCQILRFPMTMINKSLLQHALLHKAYWLVCSKPHPITHQGWVLLIHHCSSSFRLFCPAGSCGTQEPLGYSRVLFWVSGISDQISTKFPLAPIKSFTP